jgi:hypothetical protein
MLHFWNIDKTIDYRINHVLDEKTNFKIEFDNHSHAFVSVQSINRCRFILLSTIHNENQHIKHRVRVNFVNLDFQRFKASFRITLSSRFLWFSKSSDYEVHEKCQNSQQILKSRSYKKIMNDSSRDKWLKIMKNENKFLLINETWKRINSFRNRRIFRDKWVYKIKREEHDEILRYKTRWVIWDFEQIERLNYTKTFVSMIKFMSYKTMYVITIVNDWKIEQMNVKIAFLYDKIHENVFVVQLTNFEQSVNQICKLNKTLYDLKQFSRIWFETLVKFLFSFDYASLNVEFNVFMKDEIMIVIYLNDSIFTEFNLATIFWLKNALNKRFEMSDLDSCTYYFDMMIFKNRRLKQLILNQNVYVEQMLRDHEMWDCKSLIIFMNVSCRLNKIFDEYTIDKSLRISYQSIVKSLMYIMLKTRLDIIYSISMINWYVSNLTQSHWQAVKRIFRYLRKTYQMKLIFREALKLLDVASSDTEAGLRDHVMWLQSRDVAKMTVYRADNFDPSISTYIESRSS